MPYIPLYPTSRDNLAALYIEQLPAAFGAPFTLVASPPGSGKTRLMRHTANQWYATHSSAIVYVLTPTATLSTQVCEVFRDKTLSGRQYILVNGLEDNAESMINRVLSWGYFPVVFFTNAGFQAGTFTASTRRMLRLFNIFKARHFEQLALLDEIDKQITHLTGGMSATYYHSKGNMSTYNHIRQQTLHSLNLFDNFREASLHVMGFSGTLNNMICSKLTSTGYKPSDVLILNAFPIESLYTSLRCEAINTESITELDPFLRVAEAIEGHILIVFPTKKKLTAFIENYTAHRGHPPVYTRIDSDTAPPSPGTPLQKYILGIDMLSLGFDLATWMPGKRFVLGILVRALADSQPLSTNPNSELHHPNSAMLLQTLLRMRDGGIFLIPERLVGIDILSAVRLVSEIIHDGWKEFEHFGAVPVETFNQLQRWNLTTLVAICQNLQLTNKPIMTKCLELLSDLTEGRLLEREAGPDLDIEFWADAVGVMWEIFWAESDYCTEDCSVIVTELRAGFRSRRLVTRGGGERTARLTDEEIRDAVIARADNCCCHCGQRILLESQRQLAHIHRHDEGGLFTLDNLCVAHRSCDAAFDEGRLLLSPDKTTFFHDPLYCLFTPDMSQLAHISTANLRARWAWAKKIYSVPGADDTFFHACLLGTGLLTKTL